MLYEERNIRLRLQRDSMIIQKDIQSHLNYKFLSTDLEEIKFHTLVSKILFHFILKRAILCEKENGKL